MKFCSSLFKNLFGSKLGVPIKTTISTNVLKEALSGTVRVRPLPVGTSVSGKVNNHLNRKKACCPAFLG